MNTALAIIVLIAGTQLVPAHRPVQDPTTSSGAAKQASRRRDLFERAVARTAPSVVLGVFSYMAPYPGRYEYLYL
jgi:hypothetical protein